MSSIEEKGKAKKSKNKIKFNDVSLLLTIE